MENIFTALLMMVVALALFGFFQQMVSNIYYFPSGSTIYKNIFIIAIIILMFMPFFSLVRR